MQHWSGICWLNLRMNDVKCLCVVFRISFICFFFCAFLFKSVYTHTQTYIHTLDMDKPTKCSIELEQQPQRKKTYLEQNVWHTSASSLYYYILHEHNDKIRSKSAVEFVNGVRSTEEYLIQRVFSNIRCVSRIHTNI